MATPEHSPHQSFPKQKHRKNQNPSVFKRKLFDKRPISSRRSTVVKEENEALKIPAICYSNAIPAGEGCSSLNGENEIEKLMSLSHPSFLMTMLPSHVSKGFWLGIPKQFSAKHLPKNNVMVTLVAYDGRQHQVKFKWERNAFSGGWKAFAQYHNLEEDDELFFELIEPCTFEVEIMRMCGTAGVVGKASEASNRGKAKV